MFHKETPQEAALRKLEQLELNLAEANKGIVDTHRALLQHQATVAALLGDVAKIVFASNEAVVAHHATALLIAKAQSANRVIRKLNGDDENKGVLAPLQKEIPSGNEEDGGVHLANSLAPEGLAHSWQSWPPIAQPLITELPPKDLFPARRDLALAMDDAQVLRLIAFYNDSFGIYVDDTLEMRRRKFLLWCSD